MRKRLERTIDKVTKNQARLLRKQTLNAKKEEEQKFCM